ncbi:MAG: divalent-cation tolerance protein CutA [Deltaproteobacteria bacterium]|nr:divalent-cation tolerance protein CutA [Deltaproteobacteria bacterium]
MEEQSLCVVLVTAPSIKVATNLSNELISRKLAACVNILPNVTSIYRWQGKVESSNELLLVIKTTNLRYKALQDTIVELHPYETPEIIALNTGNVSAKYCQWVIDETSS